MRNLQWAGVLASMALAAFSIVQFRRKSFSRLNLLTGLAISLALLVIAIFPQAIDPFRTLLMMENRWFSVTFLAVVLLYVLYLSALGRISAMNTKLGELVRALAKAECQQNGQEGAAQDKIAVVIPAYNEERAIRGVLTQLPKSLLGLAVEPIVVVDGGKDHTEEIARQEGYLVAPHRVNRGQGDALRTGFDVALSRGAAIVMTMDADGQHRAEDMASLVQPVLDGKADFVMGSRFLGEYEERGGWRHSGIVFFTKLINLLTGLQLTDCTNGFRAIRASELSKIELREDRFNAPELIMEAARHGLRLQEVPVTILKRTAGQSKKPPRLGYPLGFLATIIKVWLR